MYTIRKYDPKKDLEAGKRIWKEVQWLEAGTDEEFFEAFLTGGRALVAEANHSAECLVTAKSGTLKYLDGELALSIVASVTTSHIARKQGLAKKLTAQLIAEEAEAGALVSTLGIFEQGFYEQLGYGTGGYEHRMSFDPADLKINEELRTPIRLTKDDWQKMHKALINRKRRHGGVNVFPEEYVKAELGWSKNGFGLGYEDGPNGELTHYFWASSKGEHGPLVIHVMAFQTIKQFHELMGVIKSLGDQYRLVKMREPAGIQLQDLVRHPFRSRIVTEKTEFEHTNRATAYWQMRICDLEACIAATHLNSSPVRFNLELDDPLEQILDTSFSWRGIAGKYTISLGPDSIATKGFTADLPLLKTDVGTFTRLWLGSRPATGLAATGYLLGDESLLDELDKVLCLPDPHPDWDY